MDVDDRDAENHYRDAEFQEHVGEDVDGFASPPPLCSVRDFISRGSQRVGACLEANWDFCLGKVPRMLTTTMCNSQYGKSGEENEKYLCAVC